MLTAVRRLHRSFLDGKYALVASVSDGLTADATVKESGGKAVNRLLAKALAGDADTLDGCPDGSTYKRVLSVASGLVQTASVADGSITKTKTESRFRCLTNLNSADQSIANNSPTAVSFDAEDHDVGSLHDNVTNNTRITIPAGGDTGQWIFVATVRWAGNATGDRTVIIRKNGAGNALGAAYFGNPGSADFTMTCTAYVNAPAVSDYFEVVVTQLSGGNLNVRSGRFTTFQAIHVW